MAVESGVPTSVAIAGEERTRGSDDARRSDLRARLMGGGTAGNERLTAAVGVVLLVLLLPQYGPWLPAQQHLLGGR